MIPEAFLKRMKNILGDEYDSFSEVLSRDAVRAFRINTLKATEETVSALMPYRPEKLSYCDTGYIIREPEGIGNTPEHHAGAIYVQDPGAMSALSALKLERGWWVLDLCAAPGGKSGQAAGEIGDGGFILANEYVPKRAKICVQNFERLGIRCGMVTSLDTGEFKKYFDAAFDLVICDAPCSGEGMFRKGETAISEWSEENVKMSASRQREILDNAAPLVRPGGYLLYSTCTYSLLENEMQIDAFLSRHPEFYLTRVRPELEAVTRDGVRFEGCISRNIHLARRFYPHVSDGEGQFVALLRRREDDGILPRILYKSEPKPPSREALKITESFLIQTLGNTLPGKLYEGGGKIYLTPHGLAPLPNSVFLSGVLIGEIRKGILHPEHQFFSAFGREFILSEELSGDPLRLEKYLLGEEIETALSGSGYLAVLYRGVPLGGGKLSSGRIKNYYPKGLRKR